MKKITLLFIILRPLEFEPECQQQRRQEQQVGEHRHKERYRYQQSQGYRAAKLRRAKHQEAAEEYYRRVDDGNSGLPQCLVNRFGDVAIVMLYRLTEFGEEVDGVVNGNAEGDVEHQNRARFEPDAAVAHYGSRYYQRYKIGDNANDYHFPTLEQPHRTQRDKEYRQN